MNFILAGFDKKIRCKDDRVIVWTNIGFQIKVVDSIPTIVSIYLLKWNIAILSLFHIIVLYYIKLLIQNHITQCPKKKPYNIQSYHFINKVVYANNLVVQSIFPAAFNEFTISHYITLIYHKSMTLPKKTRFQISNQEKKIVINQICQVLKIQV